MAHSFGGSQTSGRLVGLVPDESDAGGMHAESGSHSRKEAAGEGRPNVSVTASFSPVLIYMELPNDLKTFPWTQLLDVIDQVSILNPLTLQIQQEQAPNMQEFVKIVSLLSKV